MTVSASVEKNIFPDKLEIFHLFGNIKDDNCIGLRTGNKFYELNRTTPPQGEYDKEKSSPDRY